MKTENFDNPLRAKKNCQLSDVSCQLRKRQECRFSRGLRLALGWLIWGGLFALGASAFWLALFALCMAGGSCESWQP